MSLTLCKPDSETPTSGIEGLNPKQSGDWGAEPLVGRGVGDEAYHEPGSLLGGGVTST